MKRELRKKSKNITQPKPTYKGRAAPAGNKKSRSFSGYNNFFDKNKDKNFREKTPSSLRPEIKNKALPDIPASRTISQSNAQVNIQKSRKDVADSQSKIQNFFPKKVGAHFVNNESDYEGSSSDSNNNPDFCGHIDINL
jgi:hypothetical protein